MKEAESRTYSSILQRSHGNMCAECHSAVLFQSPVVKEALGYDYRYVHPACYRSLPCFNLISPLIASVGEDLQALADSYERHIATLLPIPALEFSKRCSFAHSPRERILLEALKFLSLPDTLVAGQVCTCWYEAAWNEELWPRTRTVGASLRVAALQVYLNMCKSCGRELTVKSAFVVLEYRKRGYCKACFEDGLRPVSIKVVQICLGLSPQFLSALDLPVVATIGIHAFTLLEALKNRMRTKSKSLLAPICRLIKANCYQEAMRAVTELKKSVFVRAVPALMKDVFPQALAQETAQEWSLDPEETEELTRLLQLA